MVSFWKLKNELKSKSKGQKLIKDHEIMIKYQNIPLSKEKSSKDGRIKSPKDIIIKRSESNRNYIKWLIE